MATINRAGAGIALAGVLLLGGNAHALSPAAKCEAAKLKVAGKYDFCRLKAEAKAAKTGAAPDFSKCDAKYGDKWMQAETGAGGMCPSSGDRSAIQAFITEHTDAIEAALDGGTLPEGVLTCNADLATCQSQPAGQRLKTGQTTCYDGSGAIIACASTGQDGELQRGLSSAYIDNGDGTITDTRTGLMWEKLSDDGSIHDKDNFYTWTNAFSAKIATLNVGFAGHTDWRLPNVNELQSLTDYGAAAPAVFPAFNSSCLPGCLVTMCNCTVTGGYWSSTTNQIFAPQAWAVDFNTGTVVASSKSINLWVRAVRGGS